MVKWPSLQTNLSFIFLLSSLLLILSCAPKSAPRPHVGVPLGPDINSSLQSFVEGLNFMRENPSEREDERVQRFLWLDQWMKILEREGRLTPQLSEELYKDLNSFVEVPFLSKTSLVRIAERAETGVGKNIAYYQLYQESMRNNRIEEALSYLSFIQEDGRSKLYSRAQELLKLQSAEILTESRKIGVLLPLSGDLKAFGESVLHSIQLVSEMAVSDGIEFVVKDVGATDDDLLDAFQELVLKENVAAILGPLTTSNSEFIFERAQILSVPVISLAPRENLEMFGPYSFRSALTLHDQISRVSDLISREMSSRRVAILYPDSRYGWDAAQLAKKMFPARGIDVTEIQVYPVDATDFKAELQKMARLDYPKLRSAELCQNRPAGEACVEDINDLAPLVNFEVLFIPDFANTAGLILPTLPFLRMYGIQVVGLSGFHDPKLLERGQQHAEGVIFTDGFFEKDPQIETQFFVEKYKKLSGAQPSALAAESFDAALLLTQILRSNQEKVTRPYVFNQLRNLRNFSGVTGRIFSDGQQLRKEAKLFVVRDGKFQAFQ